MTLVFKLLRSLPKVSFSSYMLNCCQRKSSTFTFATKNFETSYLSSIPVHSNNQWIWQNSNSILVPAINIKPLVLPNASLKVSLVEPLSNVVIEDPLINNIIIEDPLINNDEMQAIRMIVIRRKKMKKHKRKKFLKRMKFVIAKRKQRRALKREKEFHALLIGRCREAEAFNAEEYVANKLRLASRMPPPRFKETPLYKELMRRKKLKLPIDDLITLK